MAIFYFISSIIIVIVNAKLLPETIMLIIKSAFTPAAALEGFTGITIRKAIQNGIARGVFFK